MESQWRDNETPSCMAPVCKGMQSNQTPPLNIYLQMDGRAPTNRSSYEKVETKSTCMMPILSTRIWRCPPHDYLPITTSPRLLDYQPHLLAKLDDLDLQSFLLEGLKSWISDPQGDEISLHHFHSDNQPTFQLQLNLGWYSLITGLIHPSLTTLQQTHYSKPSKTTTGASWAAQFIHQLWHHLYELWLLWNQALHQWTINDNHGSDNLDYSITVEYHIGPIGLPTHFNGYFRTPLATLLAKDTMLKKKMV